MDSAVKMLAMEDADAFAVLTKEANADSGGEGGHYHPYGADEPLDPEVTAKRMRRTWALPRTEPGWRRTWGWFLGSRLVGSVTLYGGALRCELHRCSLGMGIVPEHRGQGGGSELLRVVIGWCEAEPRLAWLELGVFSDNPAAARLYRRFGFEEYGRKDDAFRVDGASLQHVLMALSVAGEP